MEQDRDELVAGLQEQWKRKFDEEARLRREAEAKQAEIERKASLADELAAALKEAMRCMKSAGFDTALEEAALQKWERR